MRPYIIIFDYPIPSYGLLILIGLVLANIIGFCLVKRYKADGNELIVCEGYALLGAVIGAKALYLWVSRKQIVWENILDLEYFNTLMKGGFVFYGGLIGGLVCLGIGGRLHKIDLSFYVRKFIFLIPFIHGFGRIGCFLAGCCYGRPYHGIGAVEFPPGSLAPAGVSLFPVQLAEAMILFLLSLIVFITSVNERTERFSAAAYLIGYGVVRFVLEFFRFDEVERGYYFYLSTSQWISIIIVVLAGIYISVRRFGDKNK